MSDASAAMELFRGALTQRFDPRALAALGGADDARIVGYLDTGFPEELAIAAGFLPILITAEPDGATATADPFLDLGAPSRIRRLSDALITGLLDDIDLLCVTGGDRWTANTGGFLEAYRDVTTLPGADVVYLERARGITPEHRDFNRAQLAVMRDRFAAMAGTSITDAALTEAIALTNVTRGLLDEVRTRRQADRPTISGVDALTITLASRLLPKAIFNDHLRGFLDAGDGPELTGARLFISGSSLDHVALHTAVEATGAIVVGEDTEFGQRTAGAQIDPSVDPLDALTDHYTFGFPEPWAFGRDRRIALRVEVAVAARADGEVFFHVAHDSSVGWDFPDQRAALQRAGIPVLAMVDQDDALSRPDDVTAAVAAFVASIDEQSSQTTRAPRAAH